MKDNARKCSFSPWSATDITNAAQLAIAVCGITARFDMREELVFLYGMHDTTRGEDFFEQA